MSWLFDRLCEIAIADQVDVVICATAEESAIDDDSSGLAEVLARAAGLPQLTMTLLPNEAPVFAELGTAVCDFDVEDLDPGQAVETIAAAVGRQQHLHGVALRMRGSVVSLLEVGGGCASRDDECARVVFATDAPGHAEELRFFGRRGLGIAIGGVDPDAQVHVDTFLGVVSIVDALATLRSFAFGDESVRPLIGQGAMSSAQELPPPLALRRIL